MKDQNEKKSVDRNDRNSNNNKERDASRKNEGNRTSQNTGNRSYPSDDSDQDSRTQKDRHPDQAANLKPKH